MTYLANLAGKHPEGPMTNTPHQELQVNHVSDNQGTFAFSEVESSNERSQAPCL